MNNIVEQLTKFANEDKFIQAETELGLFELFSVPLTTGKLPKEGTKARESVLNGVKETKTIGTIVSEMVKTFKDNQNEETRSAQSKAQSDAYTPITKGVKRNVKSGRLHIWAMSHTKIIIEKGEYSNSTPGIEVAQKNAIQSQC